MSLPLPFRCAYHCLRVATQTSSGRVRVVVNKYFIFRLQITYSERAYALVGRTYRSCRAAYLPQQCQPTWTTSSHTSARGCIIYEHTKHIYSCTYFLGLVPWREVAERCCSAAVRKVFCTLWYLQKHIHLYTHSGHLAGLRSTPECECRVCLRMRNVWNPIISPKRPSYCCSIPGTSRVDDLLLFQQILRGRSGEYGTSRLGWVEFC